LRAEQLRLKHSKICRKLLNANNAAKAHYFNSQRNSFIPRTIFWRQLKISKQRYPHRNRRVSEHCCKMERFSKAGVPKLPLAMYPFSISVDEHVPLNMGAGRIFFSQGPKVDFPGTGV